MSASEAERRYLRRAEVADDWRDAEEAKLLRDCLESDRLSTTLDVGLRDIAERHEQAVARLRGWRDEEAADEQLQDACPASGNPREAALDALAAQMPVEPSEGAGLGGIPCPTAEQQAEDASLARARELVRPQTGAEKAAMRAVTARVHGREPAPAAAKKAVERSECIEAAESVRRMQKFWEDEAKKRPSIRAAELRVEVKPDGAGYRLTHLPTGVCANETNFGRAVRDLQKRVDDIRDEQEANDRDGGDV